MSQSKLIYGSKTTDPSWLVRGLSLDGGGLFGLVQSAQTVEMERRADKPVSELFHMMSGTSFGGIHAIALSVDKRTGKPFMSAQEFEDLVVSRFRDLFVPTIQGRFNLDVLWNESYKADGLEKVIEEVVGDARLSDLENDVLITAYDMKTAKPRLFKSWHARGDFRDTTSAHKTKDNCDYALADIARATSAAPTYYEPHPVACSDGFERVLIDGGVIANHPAVLLKNALISKYGEGYRPFIASVGTGKNHRFYDFDDVKSRGKLGWIEPVISVMMDGQQDLVDYDLRQALGRCYLRIQTPLSGIEGLPDADFGFDIRDKDELAIVQAYGAYLRDVIAAQDHEMLERFFTSVPLRPREEFTGGHIDRGDLLSQFRASVANDDALAVVAGSDAEDSSALPGAPLKKDM